MRVVFDLFWLLAFGLLFWPCLVFVLVIASLLWGWNMRRRTYASLKQSLLDHAMEEAERLVRGL